MSLHGSARPILGAGRAIIPPHTRITAFTFRPPHLTSSAYTLRSYVNPARPSHKFLPTAVVGIHRGPVFTSRWLEQSCHRPDPTSFLASRAFRRHLCVGVGQSPPSQNQPLRSSQSPIISWRSTTHHKSRRKWAVGGFGTRRWASGFDKGGRKPPQYTQADPAEASKTTQKPKGRMAAATNAAAGSGKQLFDRLPHLPKNLHRPTKEEFLAAATGFWSRFRVHFKWFSIKDMRPFNSDDISAFFSWILVGHVVWILLGTTTFFSLAILMVNTVFAQETLARWIGKSLTKQSGMQVVFESAIVPKWKDGVISFKNVFVSRRPGQGHAHVSKGSQANAATAAAAAVAAKEAKAIGDGQDEDTNYTQFDLSFDTINVTLSFAKWFNGKGLLRDVEMEGIRGVVDRRSVQPLPEGVDPRSFKHEHHTGDFELESFKMHDLLITVYQPGKFRPFPVSIYSCDLPQLRKQWLFYDFLSANNISGSFDNSLFTIHPRQKHNYSGAHPADTIEADTPIHWKRHSRIRIDGLNIGHLNRGVEGPFGWISEGNVDIIADLMIPADDEGSIAKVMSDFYDRVEASVTSNMQNHIIDNNQDGSEAATEQSPPVKMPVAEDERYIILDLRIHLNDVRAAVPIFTREISYVNNALIRPIVAYINSQRAFIPVNCRVVKGAKEFDGSWTLFDSGLMDDMSRETYDAFARSVLDEQARIRRFKKVGMWTLQLAAQALFVGLAGNFA